MNDTINGKPINRMGCCGVFAVAFVAAKPVEEVFGLFKKRFHRGNRWRGRTYDCEQSEILTSLGVKWSGVSYTVEGRKCSLAKWVDWHTVKCRTYIVRAGHHIQVIRDGIVHDQNGSKPIGEFWGRNKRVRGARLMAD